MGLIRSIFGGPAAIDSLGKGITDVAEVFTENKTRRMEMSAEAYMAAMSQYGVEFSSRGPSLFDTAVNAMNRLPRPMLALGTLGLFVYAMVDPHAFAARMAGLNYVPEPLWWLLGAIVSFYFGARELHYFRSKPVIPLVRPAPSFSAAEPVRDEVQTPASDNAALEEWRSSRRN